MDFWLGGVAGMMLVHFLPAAPWWVPLIGWTGGTLLVEGVKFIGRREVRA